MNARRLRRTLLACLMTLVILEAKANPDNNDCYRCHGMTTLALRDPVSGTLTNYHVDAKLYQKATHGRMACSQCHKEGFDTYPHELENQTKANSCLTCHKTPGKWDNLRLSAIGDQYGKSVHFKGFQSKGGCFTCHDPHEPDPMGQTLSMEEKITHANKRCLDCHNSNSGTDKPNALLGFHRWLPETQRHLTEVRCVDCHTQDLGSAVHAIGTARTAEKQCESCHGRDSILTAKLYRYRVLEERQRGGFLDSVVLNEAYVIGLTRNPWLDWGSLLLVVGTLVTLLGHGLARWIMAGRKKP